MRVAMIGHKRLPSREGGVEVVVTELATHMAAKGIRVEAYNRWEPFNKRLPAQPDGEPMSEKEYRGVRLHKVLTSKHPSLNAFVYSVFATIRVAFRRFDVVHCHAEGTCAMLWLLKLRHMPIVVTIHGLDWERAKWGAFATKYLLYAERMAVRCADEIIVLSKNMQQYFRDKYGRETVYINNGLTVHEPEPPKLITEKFGLKKGGYFLYLGRIVPEKGLHYLIEAYNQLDTDIKLVIAGDTNTAYGREILTKLGGDERVILPGFVQGDLLAELYSNCAAYILPSDVEGMAITMLEAMSYGAPCILSDIPENTEVAGAYAHCFPKGDVTALAQCLRTAVSEYGSPACEERRQRGVEYIRTCYGYDHVVEETVRCYERAIQKHQRRAAARA